MTITLKIKPNPTDADVINSMMAGAVTATLAKIKQVEDAVADIRDPQTGEGATVTWKPDNDGVTISIKGSEFVRAEAQKRVEAFPQ